MDAELTLTTCRLGNKAANTSRLRGYRLGQVQVDEASCMCVIGVSLRIKLEDRKLGLGDRIAVHNRDWEHWICFDCVGSLHCRKRMSLLRLGLARACSLFHDESVAVHKIVVARPRARV